MSVQLKKDKDNNHPMYGKFGKDHQSFKPLTDVEVKLITQFPDWKDRHPATISNRLRSLGSTIGVTRVKRLQDSI